MKYLLSLVVLACALSSCRHTTEPDEHPYMRATIDGVHWDADTATIASSVASGPSCLVIYGYSGISRVTERLIMFTLNRDSIHAGGTYSSSTSYRGATGTREHYGTATVHVAHYSATWLDGTFEFSAAAWGSTDSVHVVNGEFGVYNTR